MSRKVLVLGEVREGSLRNVSFEAVSTAKTIAEGGEVVAVLVGQSVNTLANEMIQFGADRAVVVEDEKLASYSSDGFSQALLAVIDQEKPDGLVLGHTALGKDYLLSLQLAYKVD
jgi:electron transfer flavoprotein alpha subunit